MRRVFYNRNIYCVTGNHSSEHAILTIDASYQFPRICQTCNARLYGICGALKVRELEYLNAITTQKVIKKGEIITLDDDEVFRFANIISGAVKLSKVLSDGRQQIVGLQFAPEFVGRPFQKNSNLTIEAASDLQLCFLPRNAVEQLIEDSSTFKQRMLDQTLLQLDQAREWMVTLGRKTASEKIASFLSLVDKHIGKEVAGRAEAREVELPLNRHEIADFLGLTIETVSRQITKFRKAGLIEVSHNNDIVIPNMARVHELCGE